MSNGYENYFKARRNAKNKGDRPKVNTKAKHKRTADDIGQAPLHLTAEEALKHISKKKPKKPKKASFPFMGVFVTLLGLIVAGVGVSNPQYIEEVAGLIEFSAVTKVEAADEKSAANNNQTKGEAGAKSASSEKAKAVCESPSAKNWTPEEISHFSKLSQRKQELDLREAELNELENELHKQKGEIEARIKKLEDIRAQISGVLRDRVKVDEAKVEKLVQVYSNMKPQSAAKVFSTMNENLAIEILGKMKKKSAAEILNLLDADKAQMLTEKFAGYKRR